MVDQQLKDEHDEGCANQRREHTHDQTLPGHFLEGVPLGLKSALEDKAGQEDGKYGIGIHLAHQMRGLSDYSQVHMVDSEGDSRKQQERIVGDLPIFRSTLVILLNSLRIDP